MAFCKKLGRLVRHSVSQNETCMVNAIRCMSTSATKLFIGGLSYGTDDGSLKEAFSGFGDVVDARVIVDRDTGRSRGYGFVNFASNESASSALSAMDGQELQGRNIRVSFANETPRSNFNRGGGGFGNRSFGNSGF